MMNALDSYTIWIWTLICLIGAGTFAIRLSLIQLLGRMKMSDGLTRLLRFVPPAALSALIVPAVVHHQGAVHISLSNGRITAALVAAAAALATRNTLLTICSGMGALWIFQALA